MDLEDYMIVSLRGTDCSHKSPDAIFFPSYLHIKHINVVFKSAAVLFTEVTKETLSPAVP